MSTTQFATAAFYVDLLAEQGTRLSEPYTRQLDGKLRELGGPPGWSGSAVTYWITSGRRIVLLTMFVQTRMRQTGILTLVGLLIAGGMAAVGAGRRPKP